jgi:hypothetical protein
VIFKGVFYLCIVPFIFLIIALLFSLSFADSRALAMGNAAIADTSMFFAAYHNPGMLAFKRDLSAALNMERSNSSEMSGSFGIENGIGNRMGIGAAAFLKRGEDTLFIIDETDSIIDRKRADFSIRGYAGLSYRLSKADGIGVSLSTESQSPLSIDLGWFRFWNEKWQSGAQVRNLGSDDSRTETFEAGLTHRNLLFGKPVSASLMLLGRSALKGRFGFEWEAIKNGDLRFGLEEKSPSAGIGYAFNIGDKTLFADYAIPLSLTLRMKF